MTTWPDLLATALLGTDRRGHARPEEAATELLDEAAAWSVYRRAGTVVRTDIPAPPPSPDEHRDVVVPVAARRLAGLMEPGGPLEHGQRMVLLAEWLTLVAAHGQRMPPEYLPDLLDLGRTQPDLRAPIAAAGGARVDWLAAQNPDWSSFAGTHQQTDEDITEERDWLGADRARRVAFLRTRRRSEPDAARVLLEQDWPRLDSDERIELIGALAVGLSGSDEAFLERALDDRRAEVRQSAADLLGRVPGSALNGRMTARARACLRRSGDSLEITPPTECDQSMRRDGIAVKPQYGSGERAWWLHEVLARTPLADLTPLSPVDFLGLEMTPEWKATVLDGLARAAITQKDPQWAVALLDVVPGTATANLTTALYPVVPPDELTRRGLAAIAGRPTEDWVAVLLQIPRPWTLELAQAALDAWVTVALSPGPPADAGPAQVAADRRVSRALDHLSRHAGLAMPPALAPSASAIVDRVREAALPDARMEPLIWLAGMLLFRHQMTQEIA
jgi:hypothetical protein